MRIYIVCPVRIGVSKAATAYVEKLEAQGHTVFYPPRDVDQHDPTGLSICTSERTAILNSDEVHTFYDARSQGIHFDLGMAFALNKPIKIIEVLTEESEPYKGSADTKSYLNALRRYEKQEGLRRCSG